MAGWQDTIAPGSTDTTSENAVDLTIMAKLTVSGAGNITMLRYYQNDGAAVIGNCKLALYDDSSPKNLLGSASAVSVNPGGSPAYIAATLSVPAAVTNGQVVWIALNNDTDAAFDARYLDGGAANTSYKFEAYSGFPTSTYTEEGTLTRTYAASAFLEEAGGGTLGYLTPNSLRPRIFAPGHAR
jgi:hypothetical protein